MLRCMRRRIYFARRGGIFAADLQLAYSCHRENRVVSPPPNCRNLTPVWLIWLKWRVNKIRGGVASAATKPGSAAEHASLSVPAGGFAASGCRDFFRNNFISTLKTSAAAHVLRGRPQPRQVISSFKLIRFQALVETSRLSPSGASPLVAAVPPVRQLSAPLRPASSFFENMPVGFSLAGATATFSVPPTGLRLTSSGFGLASRHSRTNWASLPIE